MQIGNFIKDLFAGFQLLNLKNDILRKRSDAIKYSVSGLVIFGHDILTTAGQKGRGCRVRSVSAQPDSQGWRHGLTKPTEV